MTWSYLQEHVIIGGRQHSVLIKTFIQPTSAAHYTKERVAVVKLGGDKSMDENLGSLGRNEFSYGGIVKHMVEG